MSSGPPRTVKTTKTVFDIIETLREKGGARVTEVADELGLANSTVHRHLVTLTDRKYVTKEGDVYHVGLKFLELGEFTRSRQRAYSLAETKVAELAEETGERAQFIVEEHGDAVYIHTEAGENAVKTDSAVGKRIPIHATSAGKVILAHMLRPRLAAILDDLELTPETENTITDMDEFRTELEGIRERGYAFNDQEHTEGLRAIAVPINDPNEGVIGALGISGPTHRMTDEWYRTEIPNLLLGSANELELNVEYS
jgi:DNA-binding IclR family transcriptional regulator